MDRFNSPLDDLRVASPCPANWNEMYGNDRKRFCGRCKLNVYNLSDMTRSEAEQFLITSEGRVCVRFYRRADGTVLTQNCPVGWAAIKRRISRVATAAFSVVAGFFGGLAAFNLFRPDPPVVLGSITIVDPLVRDPTLLYDLPAVAEERGMVQGGIGAPTVGMRLAPAAPKAKKLRK